MTTQPTHTPTPWKIGEKPIEISGTFFEVIGGNGIPTSFLQERIDEDLSDRSAIKNHNADAAFIVRAVNAHEAMLDTLKYILSLVEDTDGDSQNGTVTMSADSWESVRDIIAKAEEK